MQNLPRQIFRRTRPKTARRRRRSDHARLTSAGFCGRLPQ